MDRPCTERQPTIVYQNQSAPHSTRRVRYLRTVPAQHVGSAICGPSRTRPESPAQRPVLPSRPRIKSPVHQIPGRPVDLIPEFDPCPDVTSDSSLPSSAHSRP